MKAATFLLLVVITILCGCATHTLEHDQHVQSIIDTWLNQPIEKLLDENPDIKDPIPLGGGNHRYTYVHDVVTDAEAWNTTRRGRNDYYHLYIYVNDQGIIYKVDYSRETRLY